MKKLPKYTPENVLEKMILSLPCFPEHHKPGSLSHKFFEEVAWKETSEMFAKGNTKCVFLPFGDLEFPYINLGTHEKMGQSDTLGQFYIDELILLSFYYANRNRYKNVIDIGACVGLHSIILSRCGFNVKCFEPDPVHLELLKKNLECNGCSSVEVVASAVSDKDGEMQFVRVKDNTTANHLEGAKDSYGEREEFAVNVKAFSGLIKWADFIKIDVEGHEGKLLLSTNESDWKDTDAVMEVNGEKNAEEIFNHFKDTNVKIFAQKKGWKAIADADDMPLSWRDGSIFVSCKDSMPWA